jgi:heme A synthase
VKKPWWKSKTLWLNTLLAAGVVVEANIGLLQAKLGAQAYLAVAGFAAAANCFLRFITTQPIVEEPSK